MNLDLVLLNLAAYGSMAVGLVQLRRYTGGSESGGNSAFALLAPALRSAFPDLSAGFTWREGIARAKSLGFPLQWDRIDSALAMYEAYRYGGRPAPPASQPEVVRLVQLLRKSERR